MAFAAAATAAVEAIIQRFAALGVSRGLDSLGTVRFVADPRSAGNDVGHDDHAELVADPHSTGDYLETILVPSEGVTPLL